MLSQRVSGLLMLAWLAVAGPAFGDRLERQREDFVNAEQALQRGAQQQFQVLSERLRDYPLYPYLEYQALLRRIARASNDEIDQFLATHADTPLADLLRGKWLDHLAQHRRWSTYLTYYRPGSNVKRRCHQLSALLSTGQTEQAIAATQEIWLHGQSRPDACDPAIAAWSKAGHRTPDLVWKRIQLAMEKDQPRLAQYLGRYLTEADQAALQRWVQLFNKPGSAAEASHWTFTHPYREAMLAHAVQRLTRQDREAALKLWLAIKSRYPFSESQVNTTEHQLLRYLASTRGEDAYGFIRSVSVGDTDAQAHEARIRAALLREDWPQLISWLDALPAVERDNERWRYWLARAKQATGDSETAQAIYADLAGQRSYYGFLAADHSGRDYHLFHAETPADTEALSKTAALPGVQRTTELFALGRFLEARREWRHVTQDMQTPQLKAAAKLAEQRGWHDRAIFTLAQTGYWDDLELRFPTQHAELVAHNAQLQKIEDAWIFAVMRQESAFMNDALSHAGAVGLMQLMPATAREVAQKSLRRAAPSRSELLDPALNIALGSAYLRQVKNQLGNNAILATAAYNAGPHRVRRWLPERTLPADIWIEMVPFKETQGYLRRVLAYTVIYEKRLGRVPTRLHDRMHPVTPEISRIGAAERPAAANSSTS